MSIKLIAAFISFGIIVSGVTWYVTNIAHARSASQTTSLAAANPAAEAIATAIAANPVLCSKQEDISQTPTDEEATMAFRNRVNYMKFNDKKPSDVVKLGTCYKGTMTMVQCGADIDFGGNGQFQARSIGFDKTPSGWTVILF
ncbi:hypothetical protein WNY59_09575 [Ahrensia kielensis]|uniref:Uncharacterized protein n=1 Tax=Ahrensia kielensis TaxID=76980 RepID=A0ABU9T6U1_9HYPH